MKMYEATTAEEVLNQIEELESVQDILDTAITRLRALDRGYFRGDIIDLQNEFDVIEEEIKQLGEDYEEKLHNEQMQRDDEIKSMNYEFERCRI